MTGLVRFLRGGGVSLAGGLGALTLMADDARMRFGVPLGALLVAAAAWGVTDLLGAIADGVPPVVGVGPRSLALPAMCMVATAMLSVLSLAGAVHAAVPQALAGLFLAAGVIGVSAAIFSFGVALGPLLLDETSQTRPLLRRHGFWLVAAMAAVDLPALGVGSLTDPWETHYGEVAREVLARDDWISLWWSWEGFFYSKPVLCIWLQAISMATLGVHVAPGEMLLGVAGRLAHPEWAVRAPVVLFAMGGNYLVYKGLTRWFGRRAAFLGAIALATSPHWFLVAHQSMTDMPFVAALSGAMGLVMLAAREDEAALSARYEIRWRRGRPVVLDLRGLVVGAALLCVLPQILYLVSRNIELVLHAAGPHGLRPHLDEVRAGSGLGNCRQPGNPPCSSHAPSSRFEPWMQALAWSGFLVVFVVATLREHRTKRLLYLGAWLLAALATMAKGPAGVAIPTASVLVWLGATGRWRELESAVIGKGVLLVALVVGPWFVAELVRHGSVFTDEIFFHDMFNRAFDHVHDTNTGADTTFTYYVEQLGYGLFPWTALAPIGLFGWVVLSRQGWSVDGIALLVLWFVVAFSLFASMGTKFHHYILPAVPPAAVLAGLTLDALMADRRQVDAHARAMLAAAAISGAMLLLLVASNLVATGTGGHVEGPARLMWLFTYRYDRGWPASLDLRRPISATAALSALLLVGFAVAPVRRAAAFAWVGLALGWAIWGLDVYLPAASSHWGQRAVIAAYYANRAGPAEPIAAYQMNWKGENFYTSNRIAQFGTPSQAAGAPTLASWLVEERNGGTKVVYFVTEHNRVAALQRELQAKEVREVTSREDCNQFVLMRAAF